MKDCKDCKHCQPDAFMVGHELEYAFCKAPQRPQDSPNYCDLQRSWNWFYIYIVRMNRCGKRGRWFTRKGDGGEA